MERNSATEGEPLGDARHGVRGGSERNGVRIDRL